MGFSSVRDGTASFLDSNGVVLGITDGETYDLANGDLIVTLSKGSATLNGIAFTSSSVVNQIGNYTLEATDSISYIIIINFTIIDSTAPKVYGVIEGFVYNSREEARIITFNKGTATLNGSLISSGSIVNATGNFLLIVSDAINGTTTTVQFSYVKFGDITGDGLIDISDLVQMKNHLLKIGILHGINKEAGEIFCAGKISISDLIAVKKHILGISLIT